MNDSTPLACADASPNPEELQNALVLGGGGARAAYQAGVLQYVGEAFPDAAALGTVSQV